MCFRRMLRSVPALVFHSYTTNYGGLDQIEPDYFWNELPTDCNSID